MNKNADYLLEDSPEGRRLIVTGKWSAGAEQLCVQGAIDHLVLNYARGFSARTLDFLGYWQIRRLDVLDRTITDLSPIERLADSLEAISVEAAPSAELNLGSLPNVREIAGEWAMISGGLNAGQMLQSIATWRFDEADLHAFRDHFGLERLTIKEAPYLQSLSGGAELPALSVLGVILAPQLIDITDVRFVLSLDEFELQHCPRLDSIADIEPLAQLRFLGFSDCREIESLSPVSELQKLEVLHAWGSTRIVDGDLRPLMRLPHLQEIRMRDRREYKPRVSELVSPRDARRL